MEFDSVTDVYNFYNGYARRVDFGIITVCSRSNKNNVCYFKHLACWRSRKSKKSDNSMNPRDTKKIDCKASIKARIDSKIEKWRLDNDILEHNHKLSIISIHSLRSHKKISTPEKVEISNMHAVNIPTTQIYSAIARRKEGRRQLEFTEKDAYNYICRERQTQLKGDAQSMVLHFVQMQAKNANFYYTLDLNDNAQLRSVFWIHPRPRMACTYFSDVLTFDSTYLTNTFKMSFCPFVEVNHHGQSTLLGCALLSDETTKTFKWVFQSWLDENGGQAPNAIITDQDKAIEAAIKAIFPNVRHQFCLWHILKILEKIGHICTAHPKFMVEFDEPVYDTNYTIF
ncbi:putative protein FAR1-RELATED SEQUENCE 5 [Cocos nucifera]|uniref:Protein FAR1-RELATED SEQUENCE n=1 Tax=Cocos nucifera TaxID=13894 RepID=A0A8K0N5N5_COCNU|nr:putative protein FAR1-RELATED SEQUENCE 5 [Cocos nucifera]